MIGEHLDVLPSAAAGQMGALSRIVLLCPLSNIMEVKKTK